MSEREDLDAIGHRLGINTNTRRWVLLRDAVANYFDNRYQHQLQQLQAEIRQLRESMRQTKLF